MTNRIKEHRCNRGWTLKRLAAAIGTSPQQLSRLERGERELTVGWMRKIGVALCVDPAQILGDVSGPPRDSDFVQNDLERGLLRFWRGLAPEMQKIVLGFVNQSVPNWLGENDGKPRRRRRA